ncbi:hypothetical protein SAMN05192553_101479 [Cyclobacterium xiamenense]|uniref:Uncharacterized protein n=2 Tax=Cyclobacterium xiamenense TaxID=1297121 RepID=A0A1H6U5N4_9BACT|nr:hypothetical protein SAMN05192553_101479 [Cyclobacterium xiamenense]
MCVSILLNEIVMKLSAKYLLIIFAFLVLSHQGAGVSVEVDGAVGFRTAQMVAFFQELFAGFAQDVSKHAMDLPHTRIFDN